MVTTSFNIKDLFEKIERKCFKNFPASLPFPNSFHKLNHEPNSNIIIIHSRKHIKYISRESKHYSHHYTRHKIDSRSLFIRGFKANVCTSATPLMKSFLFPKALSVCSGSGLMATPQWSATLVIMTNKHVIQCTMNAVNISIAEAGGRVPDWSTACCSLQLIYTLC